MQKNVLACLLIEIFARDGGRKPNKTKEDGSYLQLMLAMIKSVVDVGVVLSHSYEQ